MVNVKTVSDFINSFAPYETQCQWDNSGMLVGDDDKVVKKVGICLDLTNETLAAAIDEKWAVKNLLITLSAEGMGLFRQGQAPFMMPTVAREVFDVSGA